MTIPTQRVVIRCLLFAVFASHGLALHAAERPNVLFIAVDDLNDWVGCVGGNPQAQTPNIDRLASRGMVFQNAHCAVPICNGSRTALMSGLRPSATGVYGNGNDWRPAIERLKIATLNEHFRTNGYTTLASGKIYHDDFPRHEDWDEYGPNERAAASPKPKKKAGRTEFGAAPADDAEFGDYTNVSFCVAQLEKKHDKPFFLACGVHKPHLGWIVPQKYFDQFPLQAIETPKVLDTDLDDLPPLGRLFARSEDHAAMLKAGLWKDAVQAYLAAGAFADAMVGRILEALDRSDCKNNTIVVLWGDHGFHLGEKQHWSKNTLWERSTRSPLVFVVPGVTKPGSRCVRTVDFMSIYPTLCELCGLETPKHVEGPSLKPLLANPQAQWDRPAITTRGYGNHTVRSEGWRYIRYSDGTEELYDETNDPMEWTNLASMSEHAAVKSDLARWVPTDDPANEKPVKAQTSTDKRKAKKKKKNAASKAAKSQ